MTCGERLSTVSYTHLDVYKRQIQSINESLDATILMVTHDAFSASYANRILFLRDGAIFTEILKGSDSRRVFFEKILNVLTVMGGGVNDVH